MTVKRKKRKSAKKKRVADHAYRTITARKSAHGGHATPVKVELPISLLTASPKRQSITFPEDLAEEIERGAKRQHETFSKSVLRYVRQGLAEEARAKERLREVVRKIQAAGSEEAADAYVEELTEAVFGPQRSPRA